VRAGDGTGRTQKQLKREEEGSVCCRHASLIVREKRFLTLRMVTAMAFLVTDELNQSHHGDKN
jgi:hypothetical protein